MTKDPICGMTEEEITALRAERDGKTFYFCCDHCLQKFLSPSTTAEPEENPQGDSPYTCPMSLAIQQDHPGDCPKCGMAPEPMTLPVVCWGGWPFFKRGWRSVLTGYLNMFTLVSIGVGAAFLFSAVAMLAPGIFPQSMQHDGEIVIYFEAAAVIIVLVLLGQVLELRTRRRTGSAIKALLDLAPPRARLVAAERDQDVPLDQVKVGDRLRAAPGDKVPVDGEVVEGHSSVEEPMISGEPMPLECMLKG